MIILAIETSCDETAISILECDGAVEAPCFRILSSVVSSQIELHTLYGGVVPNLAKREHQRNLVSVLEEAVLKSEIKEVAAPTFNEQLARQMLARETDLVEPAVNFLKKERMPSVDLIAVTRGPGLEPALWSGINFARALSAAWNTPLLPVNHMEGHIMASLLRERAGELKEGKMAKFPALSLLVSGGHTQLILIKNWHEYELLGETRDDAVGEAFDKVARVLGLPYPGGPAISKLALMGKPHPLVKLPRPMINTDDYEFSFSGIKTSVLYLANKLKESGQWSEEVRAAIALEFENSVTEVLCAKTVKAAQAYDIKMFILGGGVAANAKLRKEIAYALSNLSEEIDVILPETKHTTDNAAMISAAAYMRVLSGEKGRVATTEQNVIAAGNLGL